MSATDRADSADDRESERVYRLQEWVLLDGDRFLVAAMVVALVWVALVVVERLGWIPMENTQPMYYVFSGLIGGNLTLITVVVSINQLLLGQEFKMPGTLESQIENITEYRKDVEGAAGEIAPVKPLGFLTVLFENTRRETRRVEELTYGTVGEDARAEIDETVASLTEHVDHVISLLEESSDAGMFEVLAAALTTNYAEDINRIRKVRWNYGDDLSDELADALDALVDHLERIDVARQYFKSVYLQDELSKLSRVLLYTGIPAELASVVSLLSFTAAGITPLTENQRLLMPLAVAVSFVPLAVLFAFILRTATVAQRTSTTLPFTTPEQERWY